MEFPDEVDQYISVLVDNDNKWKNLSIPSKLRDELKFDLKYQPSMSADLNIFDWSLWSQWVKEFTRDNRNRDFEPVPFLNYIKQNAKSYLFKFLLS